MEEKHSIEKKHSNKKIFALMLALSLLISMTACGNSREQAGGGQDTIGQMEEGHSMEDSAADSANGSVADESESESDSVPGADMGTEILEDTTGGAETAGNILIAYFSRVGNMDFDENIDAVTSASVNMDGRNVTGNARLLAETAQGITGGDLFFIETVEKYPAGYRGTTDQAKTEQKTYARPELSFHVENMNAYDTVILIYPNWWGKQSMSGWA